MNKQTAEQKGKNPLTYSVCHGYKNIKLGFNPGSAEPGYALTLQTV